LNTRQEPRSRITAKVNELMVLCDALAAKLTQSRNDADTFAAAVVHHLCNVEVCPGALLQAQQLN
jgi:hypothetical protein